MIAMANMIRPKEKGNFRIYFLLGEFEYLDNREINGDLTIYWNKLSYRENRKIKEQVATYVTRGYKVYCEFMSNQWWIRFEVILYDEGQKK